MSDNLLTSARKQAAELSILPEHSIIVALVDEIERLRGWRDITTAPRDGTEILVRDADGNRSLAAWSNCTSAEGLCFTRINDGAGWYRRAEGEWDLFDSYAAQTVEPVRWFKIPDDATTTANR